MADFKLKYASSATLTITLASLATSSTRVAGRESSVVSNATNLYVDAMLSGKITTGTSPTAGKRIEIWAYAPFASGPTYPSVLDGTDSNETFPSENVRNSSVALVGAITVDSTSDRVYYLGQTSIAGAFGGILPERWGIWVVHDTGVNLNATGSNHEFTYWGVHYQSV